MSKTYSQADLGFPTGNVTLAFALYIAGSPFADEAEAKKEKRDPIPLVNIYDADLLYRLGYSPGTGKIEDAAALAVAANKKGSVEYSFAIDHQLGPNIEAFDAYQKALGSDDRAARDIVAEISKRFAGGELSRGMALCVATCVIVKRWRDELREWEHKRAFTARRQKNAVNHYDAREAAEAMFLAGDFYAFAAVLMDARPLFVDLWKRFPPTIRLRRGGKPRFREIEDGKGRPGKLGNFPGFAAYSADAGNETRRHLGIPTL